MVEIDYSSIDVSKASSYIDKLKKHQWGIYRPKFRYQAANALYIDIDTSHCHFKDYWGMHETTPYFARKKFKGLQHPMYSVSISGKSAKWNEAASHSIAYGQSDSCQGGKNDQCDWTSFRLFVYHSTVSGKELLQLAKDSAWQVSWIGDTGKLSGVTREGDSGWKVRTPFSSLPPLPPPPFTPLYLEGARGQPERADLSPSRCRHAKEWLPGRQTTLLPNSPGW
jgi:hypothetical protein